MNRTIARLSSALAAASLAALAVPALAQTEPGDEWQVTTEMQMGGMSMPARTEKVCSPRKSDEPPGVPKPENGDCQMYDVSRTANGMKWQMRCTGEMKATGSGEMTWNGKDEYQGTMTMNTDEGSMTMKMAGKRTGAECDAGAVKKQIAAIEAQSAAYQEQQCREGAKAMMTMYFDGSFPLNCDAKYKQEFCQRLVTEEGYDLVASRGVSPTTGKTEIGGASTTCGVDAEATRKKLCDNALKSESLVFAARHCEQEAAPLAQRECAGRSFTSPPAEKYREFCSNYARHGIEGAGPGDAPAADQPPAEAPKPESPVEMGKKALKKFIPF